MLEEMMRSAMLAANSAALQAAVVGRFHEGHKPQAGPYPVVTFKRIDTQFGYVHEGRESLCWSRVQINCWDKTPQGARAVAALIIASLPTFDLTLEPQSPAYPAQTQSPNMVLSHRADEWADPEPTIYRDILDVKIWFHE